MAKKKKKGLAVVVPKGPLLNRFIGAGLETWGVHWNFSTLASAAYNLHQRAENNRLKERIETHERGSRIVRRSSREIMHELRRLQQVQPKESRTGRFVIQRVVLRKSHFDNYEEACDWLEENGHDKYTSMIEKEGSWQFYQRGLSLFMPKRLRSKKIGAGISLVGGPLRTPQERAR